MLERDIEKYLVKRVKEIGGRAYKWVSPGNAGVPDRIVVLPKGIVAFVELKAPGGKVTALQSLQLNKLQELGQNVFVCDCTQSVEEFIDWAMRLRGDAE